MEPRIQYAKTSDGVNIAYATVGSGAPLVNMAARIAAKAEGGEILASNVVRELVAAESPGVSRCRT